MSLDRQGMAPPRLLILALLIAMPLALSFGALQDPDIWWHLAAGRWMVESGRFPQVDPFSQGGAARPWQAYSWLFEVLVSETYELAGLWGIFAWTRLLMVACLALFLRLLGELTPRFLPLVGAGAAGVFLIAPVLTPRPWLFTLLFTLALLWLILDARRRRRLGLWWALPGMFVLWANLHIQFIYGLGLLALWAAEPLLSQPPLRREVPGPPWRPRLALFAACLLGTLVNPYGFGVYETVVLYAGQGDIYAYITELRAFDFNTDSWSWLPLLAALGAAFCLGWRRRLDPVALTLLVIGVVAAFRMRRDAWLLGFIAPAVALGYPRARSLPFEDRLDARRLAIILGLALALSPALALLRGLPLDPERAVAQASPMRAARWLRDSELPGPLYNDLTWGGYLIWALPGREVSMDGRTNVHGAARVRRSVLTWAGQLPPGESDPELERANIVLGPNGAALTRQLRSDPGWRAVYRDELATIYARVSPR